jgi:hypothetical protein
VKVSTELEWKAKFQPFLVSGPSNGEWRGYCPICEDPKKSKTPSASFNFKEGLFTCFKRCGGMGLGNLWKIVREDAHHAKKAAAKKTALPPGVRSIKDAPSAKQGNEVELPSDEELRGWTQNLLSNKERLEIMRNKRGLSKKTIEQFEIGFYNRRYTIPVRDVDGTLVNVRRYDPNARLSKDKMLNLAGHGQARLFLPKVLQDNEIVIITEGEMDAIIGQQYGLPTMSHTAGASVWKPEWSPLFESKIVFICYDVDDSGFAGANKVANSISRYAKGVHKIRLPLNIKGSDLTDYLVDNGYTAKDFRALMEKALEKNDSRKKPDRKAVKGKPVSLEKSMDATLGDVALDLTVTVAGKIQPAYNLPAKIFLECDQDYGPKCAKCPMSARGGTWEKEIQRDDRILLELIDSNENSRTKVINRTLGIPLMCPKVEQDIVEAYSVEELIVMPSMDIHEEAQVNPISRRVYNVGVHDTQSNQTHQLIGYNTSDPRNGRSILMSWMSTPVQTNIDKFSMTKKIMQDLHVFQPTGNQTPLAKMEAIALDLEANVTRIYGRPEMHMAYDLVWHSAMDFYFKGTRLGKGWLELLVMGDTRTGKSEAAQKLCDHYKAGVLKSCEGATLAGLVGGAQQQGSSWMVTWGTIPLNDRRLVILDEVSGIADKNIFEQMSAVRSSGRAQITKIVSQETSARTRLIWISNPVDGRTIEQMSRGAIDAIGGLVKNPEDISRFDLAMSAASKDVDSELINSTSPPEVRHRYTAEKCSTLVSWAWSRKAEDIVFLKGVEDYVLEVAGEVGNRYVSEPPLVQPENVRIKIARIAVAIACRTFSTDETGEKVVVGQEHVDAAVEMINRLYGMESFGYQRHSTKVIREREEARKNRNEAYHYLQQHEDALHALRSINGEKFRVRDFEEFAGMMRDEAQVAVRALMGMRMVRRLARGEIRMEPALVAVLRAIEDKEDQEER